MDQDTDEPYIPLNALSLSTGDRNQEFIEKILSDNPNFELDLTNSKRNDEFGNLEIANSILSEEAVLAFGKLEPFYQNLQYFNPFIFFFLRMGFQSGIA